MISNLGPCSSRFVKYLYERYNKKYANSPFIITLTVAGDGADKYRFCVLRYVNDEEFDNTLCRL